MATTTNGISTNDDIRAKYSSAGYINPTGTTNTQCPKKSDILTRSGFSIQNPLTYTDNQLVRYSDVLWTNPASMTASGMVQDLTNTTTLYFVISVGNQAGWNHTGGGGGNTNLNKISLINQGVSSIKLDDTYWNPTGYILGFSANVYNGSVSGGLLAYGSIFNQTNSSTVIIPLNTTVGPSVSGELHLYIIIGVQLNNA